MEDLARITWYAVGGIAINYVASFPRILENTIEGMAFKDLAEIFPRVLDLVVEGSDVGRDGVIKAVLVNNLSKVVELELEGNVFKELSRTRAFAVVGGALRVQIFPNFRRTAQPLPLRQCWAAISIILVAACGR